MLQLHSIKRPFIIYLLFLILVSFGCRRSTPNQQQQDGKQIYDRYCVQCHQQNGKGKPGLYPTLYKSPWVNGDQDILIEILLKGLNKPIEVEGVQYFKGMPSHQHLSDKNIADVLSFLRSNFGNNATAIDSTTVNRVRNLLLKNLP